MLLKIFKGWNVVKIFIKTMLLVLLLSSCLYGNKQQKKVLYLSSYYQSITLTSDIIKDVKDALDVEKSSFSIYSENYYKPLTNLYKDKYHYVKFDVVKEGEIIEKFTIVFSVLMIIIFGIFMMLLFVLYKKGIHNEQSILKLIVYGPIILIPTIIAILTYTIINSNQEILENDVNYR